MFSARKSLSPPTVAALTPGVDLPHIGGVLVMIALLPLRTITLVKYLGSKWPWTQPKGRHMPISQWTVSNLEVLIFLAVMMVIVAALMLTLEMTGAGRRNQDRSRHKSRWSSSWSRTR
jgi:hypothetical protein